MKKVLILGANGRIARLAEKFILKETNYNLVLYLRNSERLSDMKSKRIEIIEGDVKDKEKLQLAMNKVNIVCANLTGDVDVYAKNIIEAMNSQRVNRLIWVAPIGICDELPEKFGDWHKKQLGSYLDKHKKAASIIGATKINFTIIRIAWPVDYPELIFKLVQKDEEFKGTNVSRKSVAAFIEELVEDVNKFSRKSVGIYTPYRQESEPVWL